MAATLQQDKPHLHGAPMCVQTVLRTVNLTAASGTALGTAAQQPAMFEKTRTVWQNCQQQQ
jgi:hypothetical protein